MIGRIAKAGVVLLLLPVAYAGTVAADVWMTSKRDERPKSDAIVVMGAAQYDGWPSPVFQTRLDHARGLYEEGVAPLIIVLGGRQEGDRSTEAEAGAAYLEQDLGAKAVTGVKAGSTTLESLKLLTGFAKDRHISKIVIVSDPLHLARAEEFAEDLGFEASSSPAHYTQSGKLRTASLFRETLLLIYFRLFHAG
jgi:uncharacterized SAM-binding protein YcdF (DUF218 family)